MTTLLKVGSIAGLGLTVLPSVLVFTGRLTWTTHAVLMAVGALLWFATAPFWMVKDEAAHRTST